jgi:hypothetical protein
MSTSTIIRDTDFQLMSEFAKPDAKKRLSLGEALREATAYNIYRNALGQIILDPVKTVPASEMWLYENAEASPNTPKNSHVAKDQIYPDGGCATDCAGKDALTGRAPEAGSQNPRLS